MAQEKRLDSCEIDYVKVAESKVKVVRGQKNTK